MYWGCVKIIRGNRKQPAPSCRQNITWLWYCKRCSLAALAYSTLLGIPATAFANASPECPASNTIPVDKPTDKKLVIIIDDLGNNRRRGEAALTLPGKLTYAVIPHTRYSKLLAEEAHQRGKEVMLHAPMSTLEDAPLGTGGLNPDLSREDFLDTLRTSLEQVPHVQGINNHMGSDLTERRKQMAWLMQELRWNNLYFVDSRTTGKTVAATVASEFNVPNLSRHVFLDNTRTREAIDERFQALLARAEKHGIAVAIGHPYPETVDYLLEALPLLPELGMELVFASEALQTEAAIKLAQIDTDLTASADPGC